MKNYENNDNFREREQVVEITLQSGEYKGTIKQKVKGNCFGLDVLSCFDGGDLCEDETFLENNCDLTIEESCDEYWFKCTLKNEAGEELEIEDYACDLNKLVVKLEIVECNIVGEE